MSDLDKFLEQGKYGQHVESRVLSRNDSREMPVQGAAQTTELNQQRVPLTVVRSSDDGTNH